FRASIGNDGNLAAADIDPYTLDACAYLNQDFNVKAFVCNEKDIGEPENSYDIITMLRVHLGPGIGHCYQSHTVPWLRSMRKALKPGGLLVIYENDQRIRTEIEKFVTPIGFKQVLYKELPNRERGGDYIYIFKVIK
ncbi:class I SAM-dependent methyltransferase, partial [bacterium]|nr:class I SAM-dependent methyltransferase [bacterium]